MKRKVFSIIGVAAIGAAVAFNVSVGSHGDSLSELALANLEALANTETTDPTGGANCKGITYRTHDNKTQSFGKINPNAIASCSLPCSNVSTNGVYGATYKCVD